MRLRRWELFATPEFTVGELRDLSNGLAAQFNSQPGRFVFRRSARNAASFFESRPYLPLRFWVIKREN